MMARKYKKKLVAKYPQITRADGTFNNFFLYGISADDSVAWFRFFFSSEYDWIESVCAFNIKSNQIVFDALNLELNAVSPRGGFCIVTSYLPPQISQLRDSKSGAKLVDYPEATITGIGPLDDYLLINVGRHNLYYSNFRTKKFHQLTLGANPLMIGNGKYNQLNSDGTLMASTSSTTADDQIYVLNMATNSIMCTFPAPAEAKFDTYYSLLFSPDSKQLLILKITDEYQTHINKYNLRVYDIASQKLLEEVTDKEIFDGHDSGDFIFCNEANYLLFPNGQLRIQPIGLARHLSLTQLLGLLILEQQKTHALPLSPNLKMLLQHNEFPALKQLFIRRYGLVDGAPPALVAITPQKRNVSHGTG